MDKERHTNIWADRLQNIPLPDPGRAWEAMDKLLDESFPLATRYRWNYRIPGIAIAVPALIIWYVAVHRGRQSAGSTRAASVRTLQGEALSAEAPPMQAPPIQGPSVHAPSLPSLPGKLPSLLNQPIRHGSLASVQETRQDPAGTATAVDQKDQRPRPHAMTAGRKMPVKPDPANISAQKIAPLGVSRPRPVESIRPARRAKTILYSPAVRNRDIYWGRTGLRLGLGLAQPVVTGNIQLTSNPYNGLNSPWKNYLPTVELDYFFSRRYYLGVEAMFNQPQDMQDNLRFMYPVFGSPPGYAVQGGPYSIVRLFYYKVPITMNFCLSRHWTMGLGIEYAQYGGGITVYNDSANGRGLQLSKFPYVHIRPFEFRGVGKIGYQLGHWEFGARFDAAPTPFINYQYSFPPFYNSGPRVVSRNTTLQFTLHYFFGDTR